MKRFIDLLVDALSETTELVTVSIQEHGFDLTKSFIIERSNITADGIELFFEDDGELFISSVCNKVINVEVGEYIKYNLLTADNTIMTVVVKAT